MSDASDDIIHNPLLVDLAKDVLAFDSSRTGSMISLFQAIVKNTTAPEAEVLWSIVIAMTSIIRSHEDPKVRLERFALLQNMISLSIGMTESRKKRDGPPPLH